MGTVETFEHTADVGLRVTGADLDDLFRTAAGGVFDYIVVNRDAVRVDARQSISLTPRPRPSFCSPGSTS